MKSCFLLRHFVLIACAAWASTVLAGETRTREYKISLDPARFSPANPQAGVRDLTQMLEKTASATGARVSGSVGDVESMRVSYWDVPGVCSLKKNNLIFRERLDEKGRRQLTLKLRSQEQAVVEKSAVEVSSAQTSKSKLEEDVTPPMQIWLSRSTTVRLPVESQVTTSQSAKLFPLIESLADSLERVNNVVMQQTDTDLPTLHWSQIKAKSSITLWSEKPGAPFVAAELSFRITLPEGDDAQGILQGPQALYAALQQSDWRERTDSGSSSTRSAFIYQVSGQNFCQE